MVVEGLQKVYGLWKEDGDAEYTTDDNTCNVTMDVILLWGTARKTTITIEIKWHQSSVIKVLKYTTSYISCMALLFIFVLVSGTSRSSFSKQYDIPTKSTLRTAQLSKYLKCGSYMWAFPAANKSTFESHLQPDKSVELSSLSTVSRSDCSAAESKLKSDRCKLQRHGPLTGRHLSPDVRVRN